MLRKYLNFVRPVRLRQQRFRIPVWGGIEVPGIRSTRKTEAIARFVRLPGVFVDVGVNLGQTLLDVKLSHPDIEYIGFEPNPMCVSYVRQLISVNGFANCVLVPAGLSDRAGLLQLHSTPNQPVDHSSTIIGSLRSYQTATQVINTVVFDEVFPELSNAPIAFVKIDVEGAELDVLKGMARTLARDRPPVYCEVLPHAGGRNADEIRSRRAELLGLVHALGYKPFHVQDAGDGDIRLELIEQFASGSFDRKLSWDYLFLAETP